MRDLQPSTRHAILRKQSMLFLLPQCLLLFITISVFQCPSLPIDTSLMWQVHQFANPIYDRIAMMLSYLGGLPSVIVMMLLLIGLRRANRSSTRSTDILFIVMSMIGAACLSWLLKLLVDRPRPMFWPRLVQDYGASFPSGHSVYAAAFACIFIVLYWRTKWRFAVSLLALMWMVLMGISRVYLGVHYPSDVLAGWALGCGWVFLMNWSLEQRKH